MSRILMAIVAACTLPAPALAQRVYFGLYEPGVYVGGNASLFLGYLEGGEFVPEKYSASFTRPFRPKSNVVGFTPDGQRVQFRVDSLITPEGDLYTGLLLLQPISPIARRDTTELFPVLLTSAPDEIHVLSSSTASITTPVRLKLEHEAQILFERALHEREPDERNATLELTSPTAQKVDSVPDLLLVRFPAVVHWPGAERGDDRASLFFIYSEPLNMIVYARFGHPEWAPSDESQVLKVRPWLFFRIGADPTPYFFGEHWCGWECNGFGIYDLNSGRTLLESF